jgi:hypothetical protein
MPKPDAAALMALPLYGVAIQPGSSAFESVLPLIRNHSVSFEWLLDLTRTVLPRRVASMVHAQARAAICRPCLPRRRLIKYAVLNSRGIACHNLGQSLTLGSRLPFLCILNRPAKLAIFS